MRIKKIGSLVTFLGCLLIILSCNSEEIKNNLLIGKWEYVIYDEGKYFNITHKGIVEFHISGYSEHKGDVVIKEKESHKYATCEFFCKSDWSIINNQLIEKGIGKINYINCKGDDNLIHYFKEVVNDLDVKVTRMEILSLSSDKCVLAYSSKGEKTKVILNRIE